jgi:3-methylfumaryl-CoA hydratase
VTGPAVPAWARGWSPVVETLATELAAHPVAGLAACLDADRAAVEAGRPLPPLWHWVALSRWPAAASIGADGHPRTGGFLPTTPYPRRMWVGCSVEVHAPAPVGAPVTIERTVEAVAQKSGRLGSFALVTVRTTVATHDRATSLLTERTQLAYRHPAATQSPAAPPAAEPAAAEPPAAESPAAESPPSEPIAGGWLARSDTGTWVLRPTPPMLMMFSALTANAHRIHYDLPYAHGVEGYPSLLVHGPLMAIALAEVVRRELPDRVITSFACRALRPLYLGTPAEIRLPVTTGGTELQLELASGTGDVHMTASFTLAAPAEMHP